MKTLFIPAKSKLNHNINLPENLPKNIAIAYSIQYEKLAKIITQKLSKNHIIYNIGQVLGCSYPLGHSQPLGCSKPIFPKSTQAILLISNGRFHAINLALWTGLPIYIIEEDKITLIPKQDIEKLRQNKKASYVNFLNSNKIGILISLKPGQHNLKKAISMKKQLTKKKSYLFIANNINVSEFENFSDIQSWVNTACPRMDMNSNKIVNIKEIEL